MSLSRTVSEIYGDFGGKSPIFPIPCILRPRWRGYPWNLVSAQAVKKLELCGYQAVKKF